MIVDRIGELLHAEKIRNAAQCDADQNESIGIRDKVGIRHQGNATYQRYKLVLLLAVNEETETDGTEQNSPEQSSRIQIGHQSPTFEFNRSRVKK